MVKASDNEGFEEARIILGLLDSVERDAGQSQRRLASELGIALGLVNAYLKRCVKKGLLKVSQAPARRYAYYLTPQGLAEKSRLTVEYLSYSFSFFRRARADCAEALAAAETNGWRRLALAGKSDLAEIAAICALERGIEIVAVIDDEAANERFVGRPVVKTFDAIDGGADGILVTDVKGAQQTYDSARRQVGSQRVLAPRLLNVSISVAEPAA
jgi:DNA-binding MarR family transcriptional regulator